MTKTGNLRQAQKFLDDGRVSQAIKLYQQIVDDDPSDLNTISLLGDLYIKAGRPSDAADHFSRIAGNFLRGGSAKSAAYILNKALKLDATNPRAQMNLGELHLHDKAIGAAHDAFIEAGAGFWREGNMAAAIGMNQRALEIEPDSRQAKAALEFIKQEMEPPVIAEPEKKKVHIELTPIIISIPDVSEDLCAEIDSQPEPSVYTQVSDGDDSLVQREFVPASDEDSIIRQIAVAEFLVGCDQVDRAIDLLRGNLQDQPDHIQTREKLKDVYLRSEMIDRACDECLNIAAIYLARGETGRAAEYVARARLLNPSPEPTQAHATSESPDGESHDNAESAQVM